MARATMAQIKLFNSEFSKMTPGREELAALPRTCKDARIMGSLMYYTGVPCCNGHLAARYTNSHHCTFCIKRDSTQRKMRRDNPKNFMAKIDDLKFQAELKALEDEHGDDT